jgi:hypothetical protein
MSGRSSVRLLFNDTELLERRDDVDNLRLFRVSFDSSDIISPRGRPTELLLSASYDRGQLHCRDANHFDAVFYTMGASMDSRTGSNVRHRAGKMMEEEDGQSKTFYARLINKTENIDGFTVKVVLDSTLASNGGLLDIIVGGCVASRYVNSITVTHTLILRPEIGADPFPPNTVETIESSEYPNVRSSELMNFVSIGCEAVGNPTPEISLWRVMSDGSYAEMTEEHVPQIQYTIPYYRWAAYHFRRDLANQGNYSCRAESGSSISENTYRVIVQEAVKIDSLVEKVTT